MCGWINYLKNDTELDAQFQIDSQFQKISDF